MKGGWYGRQGERGGGEGFKRTNMEMSKGGWRIKGRKGRGGQGEGEGKAEGRVR